MRTLRRPNQVGFHSIYFSKLECQSMDGEEEEEEDAGELFLKRVPPLRIFLYLLYRWGLGGMNAQYME